MVAPRINTASRMGHATTSFNLLITENNEEAQTIAADLEEKNGDRKLEELFLGYGGYFVLLR